MKKRINDFDLKGKKVIIRCDLNVPLVNNEIFDDTRIRSSLRTIKYALNEGAKVILLSHLGRVKTKEDKEFNSLYPVCDRLSYYLEIPVKFSKDTRSIKLTNMANNLKEGEVLLVENTRFEDIYEKKESNCDLDLAKYWASLGDIFINDAYATSHRNHASVTGIPKFLPSGIGFLIIKELNKIDSILYSSQRPFVVVLGGKKVDDKITMIKSLLTKCDKLLVGGAMSFTFLKALEYNTGKSLVSESHIEFCKKMLDKYKDKIVLPVDYVTKDGVKSIEDFSNSDIGYDIGPDTIKLFEKELIPAKRVIINGPMGKYEEEEYAKGTDKILRILDKNRIKVLVGGGDTASAASKLGYDDSFYHISTGGGATIKYLEKNKLIGIEAIENAKKKN